MKCPTCGGPLRALFSVSGSKAVPLDEHGHPDYDNDDLELSEVDLDGIQCGECGVCFSASVDYDDGECAVGNGEVYQVEAQLTHRL